MSPHRFEDLSQAIKWIKLADQEEDNIHFLRTLKRERPIRKEMEEVDFEVRTGG